MYVSQSSVSNFDSMKVFATFLYLSAIQDGKVQYGH